MELIIFIVVVLFGLAISDLVVGVSNDAVNFLNSAVGSKVAPQWVIMIFASIGIMVGVTFSSGMMEVARKGIFHPQQFVMPELLIIFLAVMLTDIMLLDVFNTFGLPTSTTVSIVFELLGAAVAVSFIKIHQAGQSFAEIVNYINTAKALAIIMGILLSIIVAFTVGAIIQYLSRLIFTFRFAKGLKRFGALWGGFAMSAITYFIVIKGAKGTSFMTAETVAWINSHTGLLLLASLITWALIFEVLLLFTRVNILKIIVLIGTLSLAMAFAANDLVNFIGVPLAGFNAYQVSLHTGGNPLLANMSALAGKIKSNTWMLLIAGAVMALTLWRSKKARSVTKTTVDLSRQEETDERFEASFLSRAIVRMAVSFSDSYMKLIPAKLRSAVAKRFDRTNIGANHIDASNRPSFDLIRASVNLFTASALISFGTSLKLPLSTTYVTFMVAMGSSFADRAWDRDSAVYRLSGVLTVVGGWFVTAIVASTVAMIFATFIFYFRLPAIILLIALAIFLVIRTHKIHLKRESETEREDIIVEQLQSTLSVYKALGNKFNSFFSAYLDNFNNLLNALFNENRKKLAKERKISKHIKNDARALIQNIFSVLQLKGEGRDIELSPRLVWSLRESARHLKELADICSDHIENQHKGLLDIQKEELGKIKSQISDYILKALSALRENNITGIEKILRDGVTIRDNINDFKKNQLKRIRKGGCKTRQSMLYLGILAQSEEIYDQVSEFLKGYSETAEMFENPGIAEK